MEWGLGQVIPLKKDLSHLMQVGIVGYDQWQVTDNNGRFINSRFPYYSAHALGMQINYIMLEKGWYVFFKYEPEYMASAHPQGRAIVFGFAYTLRIPKAEPQKN